MEEEEKKVENDEVDPDGAKLIPQCDSVSEMASELEKSKSSKHDGLDLEAFERKTELLAEVKRLMKQNQELEDEVQEKV